MTATVVNGVNGGIVTTVKAPNVDWTNLKKNIPILINIQDDVSDKQAKRGLSVVSIKSPIRNSTYVTISRCYVVNELSYILHIAKVFSVPFQVQYPQRLFLEPFVPEGDTMEGWVSTEVIVDDSLLLLPQSLDVVPSFPVQDGWMTLAVNLGKTRFSMDNTGTYVKPDPPPQKEKLANFLEDEHELG